MSSGVFVPTERGCVLFKRIYRDVSERLDVCCYLDPLGGNSNVFVVCCRFIQNRSAFPFSGYDFKTALFTVKNERAFCMMTRFVISNVMQIC